MYAQRRPTILVGVNGSAASADALRWAENEARRRHGQLRIVRVWHPEQRAYYARPVLGPAGEQPELRAAHELSETVRAVLGPVLPTDVTTDIVEGTAERELVAESEDADLLVLGSGPGTTIGPVVRTCLTQAHCPVVVVSRPPGCHQGERGDNDDTPGHASGRDAAPPRGGLLRLAARPGCPG